ncbi:hypothetical protein CAURIC_00185 [Corynebacterium auriscanis]|nr:hypothetical protein CAURIC_00185 [Corynebacterium auriscanis]
MIHSIDDNRDRSSVEFRCQTLNAHREGGFVTSGSYHQSKARRISARSICDAGLIEYVKQIHRRDARVNGPNGLWSAGMTGLRTSCGFV